jgi:DNA polymerase-4
VTVGTRSVIYAEVPAFYAAVERADNPALRDRPVIVGGDPKKRGNVQSATREALEAGVELGMPMSEAQARCPEAQLVRTRMPRYREVASLLTSCLAGHIETLEVSGLGGAYLDPLEHLESAVDEAGVVDEIGKRLCLGVEQQLGLPLRVGIASGKFLACLAAEEVAESGVYHLAREAEASFLARLSPARLPGVGEKTQRVLESLGVHTVGELLAVEPRILDERLGNHGRRILACARGRDDSTVRAAGHPKSLSHEFTFEEPQLERSGLEERLGILCQSAEAGMRHRGLRAGRVAIKVRYPDRETATRTRTLRRPILRSADIFAAAERLLDRTQAGSRPIQLIGLSLSQLRLEHEPDPQLDLFADSRPA